MNDKDYREIGEAIGGLIGCAMVAVLVIVTFACIVAFPFLLITILTSSPSVF